MQLFRSARWLLPALLLSALPVFCHSQLFKGAALHLQSALWQAATPADPAPAAQPQAPEKAIANRKHLNVSVGPLKMHLPVSGKRAVTPAATTTPTTSGTEPQPQGLRIKGTNTGAAPRTEIQAKPAAPGQAGKASAGQGRIDPDVTVVNNGAPGSPSNIEAAHIEQPITFRWTPVLPNPQDPVTYRVTVWQLMQGQTGTQAIKANQPIITKDVDEPNLAFKPDAVTGPCQSPHLCDYVWNVQALDRMGRPIKGYNDSRQVAAFQYDAQSGAFTVQQPNSPIINNEDAPGLKKPKKSTGQNQKQYILGVNMSFLMVAPPKGGGNQPGGAQPDGMISATAQSATGKSTKNAINSTHVEPGGSNPSKINVEAGGSNPSKMNTGAAPTQTRSKGIPAGGGAPVVIWSGATTGIRTSTLPPGKQATPQAEDAIKTNKPILEDSEKARSKGVYSMNDGVTDQPARPGATAAPQTPRTAGGNPPEHEQGKKILDQAPVGSLSQSVLPTAQRTPGVPATNSPKGPQGISVINEGAPGAPSARQENDKGSNTTYQPPAKVATQVKTTPQHRSSSNNGGWATNQSNAKSVGTVLPQQPKPIKPPVNMEEQPIGPVESGPTVPKGMQPQASQRSLPAPGSGTVKPQPAGHPITGINISLPAPPDGNTANWGTGGTLKPNAVQPTLNQNGNASQQNRSQPKAAPKPQSQPAPKSQKPKK
jgi:hypothetical protein